MPESRRKAQLCATYGKAREVGDGGFVVTVLARENGRLQIGFGCISRVAFRGCAYGQYPGRMWCIQAAWTVTNASADLGRTDIARRAPGP